MSIILTKTPAIRPVATEVTQEIREMGSIRRWFLRYPPGYLLAVGLLALFLLTAITGSLFAPFTPTLQAPADRLLSPMVSTANGLHILGTDALGRDVLSNMVAAARLTFVIGALGSLIGASIGTLFGMLAGYYGGRTDRYLMRLAEAQTAMPMFLVAILLLSVLGPSVLTLIIVLPTLVWPTFARIVRTETLRLRQSLFIEAAEALGCTTRTILARHLFPNLLPRIVALLVIEVGHVMLAEAGLSFLGVGVQPPDLTWGLLIADGRKYLGADPYLTIFPGIMLGLIVFALTAIGRQMERRQGAAG